MKPIVTVFCWQTNFDGSDLSPFNPTQNIILTNPRIGIVVDVNKFVTCASIIIILFIGVDQRAGIAAAWLQLRYVNEISL